MAGLNSLRLNSMFGSGASGAAPGNSFPSLGDSGGGYTPREWQRMQDNRYAEDIDNKKRLANIANRLSGQGGMMQNGMTPKPMDVVFKEDPGRITPKDEENFRLDEKRIDVGERVARDKNAWQMENMQAQNSIRQQRADAYMQSVQDRGRGRPQQVFTEDGDVLLVDNTGRVLNEFDSARYTDSQRYDHIGRNQREGIQQRNEGAANVANIRNQGTVEAARVRGEEERKTDAAKPVIKRPNDAQTEIDLKFQQYYNDPKFRDFIQFDGKNYRLNMPQGGRIFNQRNSAEDAKTYETIRNGIFGGSMANPKPATGGTTSPASPPNPGQQSLNQAASVVMQTPDGRKIKVPADKVEEAKTRGAKVVTNGAPATPGKK